MQKNILENSTLFSDKNSQQIIEGNSQPDRQMVIENLQLALYFMVGRVNPFILRLEIRQECLLLLFLLSIILSLVTYWKKSRKRETIQMRRERWKYHDMILENSKE